PEVLAVDAKKSRNQKPSARDRTEAGARFVAERTLQPAFPWANPPARERTTVARVVARRIAARILRACPRPRADKEGRRSVRASAQTHCCRSSGLRPNQIRAATN